MTTELKLARIFAVIALAVILSTLVTYWRGLTVLDKYNQVTRHAEAARRIDGILSALKDAETGQRGYLLTGSERYLEPYNDALHRLPRQLKQLQADRHPGVSATQVSALVLLVKQELAELGQTIELSRQQGAASAINRVQTGSGKAMMDQIRAVVAEMRSRLDQDEVSAIAAVTHATKVRTSVFVLSGLMNLLFIGWAFRRISREVREHRATLFETEHQRALAARQRETLRVTLSSIGDCVIVTDLDGQITFMNPAAEQLTGWKQQEAKAQPTENVFKILNEFTREIVEDPVQKVLKTGALVGLANHTLLVRKDGSEVSIDDSGAPIRDDDGTVIGVVLIFRDFTSHKNAELNLKKAKESAEAANRAKDHFLATLSHELRTPLTPVLATLNTWNLTEETPEALRADIQMMRRNVELESRLIDDLLDLTRVSKGMLSLQPEVIAAHELIGLVTAMFAGDIRSSGIELSLALDATASHVYADSARLQQVVWNVIKNAIKFTKSGEKIRVSTRNDSKGNIHIVTQDTGIGMSRETLVRIFRPFEQGEEETARRHGGLGLGMAISRALVDAMGGFIDASSDGPGRGSCFTVTIKTVKAPAHPLSAPASSNGAGQVLRKLKILLVEDHVDTALATKRLLELRGHDLCLANSVATARESIATERFDLLLCDIGLPDGTGLDLISEVRKCHSMPAISLTGFGMEEDIAKSMQAGFNAHLTKPVNLQALEATMRRLTGQDDGKNNGS